MNNLSGSLKKFLGNKNTVTILGVLLCVLILYFGYNYRINQQVELISVPYAKEDIPPKTEITKDMIGSMELPAAYLRQTDYLKNTENIIGKYTNINTTIVKGSLFYESAVVEREKLPDALFSDIEEGYILTQIPVNMVTTYTNSITPGNIIDLYFRAITDDGKAIFGKFAENIEVKSMKDSNGNDVFANNETGSPAYMYVALPEELFILVGKVNKLGGKNSMDFMIVPNRVEYVDEEKEAIEITSEDIRNFINDRAVMIDSNLIDETNQ